MPYKTRKWTIRPGRKDRKMGGKGKRNGKKTGGCEKREMSRKGGIIKGRTKKQTRTRAHCRVAAAKPAACHTREGKGQHGRKGRRGKWK